MPKINGMGDVHLMHSNIFIAEFGKQKARISSLVTARDTFSVLLFDIRIRVFFFILRVIWRRKNIFNGL